MAVDLGMRVLIVDDYPTMLKVLRSLLRQLRFTDIIEATNAKDALAMLREGGFGLVISDWNMEPMSGYELLQEVRADDTLKELEARIEEKRVELDRVVEETKTEQEQYESQRDEAAAAIDERYLRAYERLRTRVRDGRAVVPIERGAAAGFMIPPQRQVEVRQRDRIIVSEHDGRIVVDEALFDEVSAETA